MKAIKLFSMAVAALMMAACSNEDNDVQQPAQQARMIPFSATIGPVGGSTRTTITEGTGSDAGKLMVEWKGGETIALVHNGTKDVVTVGTPNPDGSAPISGTITVGTDGEDVVLVYPADAVKSVTSGTTIVPNTDASFLAPGLTQDGTLAYIGNNNLDGREGSGTMKISGGTATLNDNVTMESKTAIWKLTLTTDGTTPLAANQVTLSIGTNPIAATAVNATGKSEWTLCVVPATLALYSGGFIISAKVGTDTYTYTKAGGISLTKNTYYQSTVTMYPMAANAKSTDLGKFICTDGHMHADGADGKCLAPRVAKIFYVGNDAETSSSNTTFKHGLALALKDAGQVAFCSQQSAACFASGHQYGEANLSNDLTGIANTDELVKHASHTHYAAKAAREYKYADGVDAGAHPYGTSEWFLPSAGQWNLMMSAAGGHTELQSNANLSNSTQVGYYWASTEVGTKQAWRYYFNDGNWYIVDKTSTNRLVRACLAF